MATEKTEDSTRERLLTHAEILFAEKGFHAVSIREITAAAGSNLAAVNYHFGNKENLYLAVFHERMAERGQRIRDRFEKTLSNRQTSNVGDIFGALSEAFLKGPLTDEERKIHAQLMHREMARPTEAFKVVFEEAMSPFVEDIKGRLRGCLPENVDEDYLLLGILSMIAMTLYFNNARIPVSRITGQEYDAAFKDRIVKHISLFSEKGFGGLKRRRISEANS
ncbi:MAG: CerR family C-terminal domain-containing protein [Desulfobacterales bacterium]|nr:CerR family C-terminal domain-containing protein [Desulfobacterales bacterium]